MSTSADRAMARRALSRRAVLAALAAAMPGAALAQPPPPADRNPAATGLLLFAGSPQGLWRSRDWGVSWERVQGALSAASVRDIGGVSALLLVGPRVLVGAQAGLYSSDDWGDSWKRLDVPGEGAILSLLISRYWQADPTLFVGRTGGLFKSTDGTKFEPTALVGTPVWRLEWPGPALVAGTGKGVLISTDGGATFQGGSGLPPGEVRALTLSSFFQVDPILFAGVGREGLYCSRDGGRTWALAALRGEQVRDLAWWGPILYVLTETGVHRSSDTGRNWETLNDGLGGAVPLRMLFPQAPDSLSQAFLATESGLFHTPDGGLHWQRATRATEPFETIATFPVQTGPALPKHRKR